MVKEGEMAPEFCLVNEDKEKVCLKDFRDKWVVLYFYPKDNTPGCTTEACDFTASIDDFSNIDAEIIGVSPDSPESHQKFIKKHLLKQTLLSDTEKEVLQMYGVWREKSMYGKSYLGVVRSTFLIDPKGKITKFWDKVRVKGHVDDVRMTLENLQK